MQREVVAKEVDDEEQVHTPMGQRLRGETLGRAMIAVAGLVVLAGHEREEELLTAIVDGLRRSALPMAAIGSRTSTATSSPRPDARRPSRGTQD